MLGVCHIYRCLTWQALGHDGEAEPGAGFISIVGTGDEIEEPGERVGCGVGDPSHLRTCNQVCA